MTLFCTAADQPDNIRLADKEWETVPFFNVDGLKELGCETASNDAAREFDLKLIVLSGALKARETKMITPTQTCQILTCLLKGEIIKAIYMLHTFITDFAMSSE